MNKTKLTFEQELGQGGISAMCVLGKRDPRMVAAVHRRLWIFLANNLQYESRSETRHLGPITCMASEPQPKGREYFDAFFATGSADGRIEVWSLSHQARPVAVARRELESPILDLSWSRPGPNTGPRGMLAASLADGSILVWRPDENKVWRQDFSDEVLKSIDWFPDAQHLATSGEDGLLRIVKWPEGTEAKDGLFRHYNAIDQVRVSSCGRYVAYVSGDEKAGIFDLSHRENRAFGPPGDPVRSLGWHPEKPLLVAGTQGGIGLHYDVEADLLFQDNKALHVHPVEVAIFEPSGILAFTAGREGHICGCSLKDDRRINKCNHLKIPCGYVLSLCWLDDDRIAAGHSDGRVSYWNNDVNGLPRFHQQAHSHKGPVYGLAFQPGGRALASGSVDKHLRLWDFPTKKLAQELSEIHKKPIYGVSFSPDGRFVATGSGDTYLVVYDIAALEKKSKEKFGKEEYWHFAVQNRVLNCVAWSPAGGLIAVGLSNHQVVILPVDAEGKVKKGPTLEAHTDSVSALAWEQDGRHLWSVGYDKRIVRWRAKDWQAVAQKVIPEGDPLQALAVHPDGELVATGDWDANLRLFDLELKQLGNWRWPHYNAVEALAFHKDGERLASASSDGLVCTWRIERSTL